MAARREIDEVKITVTNYQNEFLSPEIICAHPQNGVIGSHSNKKYVHICIATKITRNMINYKTLTCGKICKSGL